jgi:hypothetical protein
VALALAVLVIVSLILTRTGGGQSPDRAPADPPVSIHTDADPLSPEREPQATGVLVWPAELTWITVAGLDMPVSTQHGPRDLAAGRAQGFSQNLIGAVLAGLHLVARTSPQVGPRVWGPTLRDQVVGPDAAAYADAVHRSYETAREQLHLPYGEPLGRIYASIAGIRVDAYSPLAASLRLLIEAPDAASGVTRAAVIVQLSWSGGDWRLIAPPRGDWASVRAPVSTDAAQAFTPLPGR